VTRDFTDSWNTFRNELDARNQRLRQELEECRNSLDAILQRQTEKFTPDDWGNLPHDTLHSILEVMRSEGAGLLFDPLTELKKARLLNRAVSAVGNYPNDIEDLLKLLPLNLEISRHDLADCLSMKGRRVGRFVAGFGKGPRSFYIRDAIRPALFRHLNDRIRWDGRAILLLVRASLALFVPWELFRNEILRSAGDAQHPLRNLSHERDEWLKDISGLRTDAEQILAAYDVMHKRLPENLARILLSGRKNFSAKRLDEMRNRWQRFIGYWSAQQRAAFTEIELEFTGQKLLETAVGISSEALASVDEEHAQILTELDKVCSWLAGWSYEKTMDPFPPPEARLMSSEERADVWKRKVSAAARSVLPVHAEFMDAGRVLPGRHPSKRSLDPEHCFLESLAEVGRGLAHAGFMEAEEGHKAVIRDIERAREVTAYSMEGDDDAESDSQIAREGIQNAVLLLDYQKKSLKDFHPVVERQLVEAIAASFYQFHLSIDENKLGLYRYLVRQKGSRVFRTGAISFYRSVKTGINQMRNKSVAVRDRALIALGWSPPSTTAVEPVVRREYLGELLRLKVVPRELPALYKRLFRLAPVEDPRFLVGRDAEIGAMAQARRQWEEGRQVSVLVAGARGSGKTSLLNCTHMAVFNDLPVTTGQFSHRITDATELHAFMASLFQTDVNELLPFLASGKRIVILEEVERTFLRTIGGFQAMRALLGLISATSKNTLWILSLNQTALHFLEKVISFDENFTHRINAMAVAHEHLTNAILLRHNLSGLRLQLTSPKSDDSRMDGVRRLLGLGKDTEHSYFESLYRQSEGVFRSAFELWLQSVDRVEGGVLYMMSPVQPEYGRMLEQLAIEDIFRLQAVLQHGSLTAPEMAQIFDETIEKSSYCMDKLIAWDILEQDPNHPGFRIRPAAGRFVRNALYRQNML